MNTEKHMISRLLIALVLIAIIVSTAGFVVLAAWDVPVAEQPVEKTLDSASYL